jgi:RNA polymerase sigma-B factor
LLSNPGGRHRLSDDAVMGSPFSVGTAASIASRQTPRPSWDGEDLLARYHATGDPRVRDQAVERYLPLARRIAARYHRRQEPFDDLMQVASLGLVKAIERWDPSRGTRFSSFAVPTISGELRRHFRATAWNLHVPRGVQEDALKVREAASRLTHELGRAPRVSELSERTGLDAEAVAEALHARAVQATVSLDQPTGRGAEDGDATLGEHVGFEDDGFDVAEHSAVVGSLVRALPARERKVLFLRFARDLTQSEIAEQVGCSQMQVSRILRRTIAALAEQVEHQADGCLP